MSGGMRRTALVLSTALASGALASLASPALADPRAVSEKDRQLASDLVKKAIARSQAGDHAGAIKLYNQAYLLLPNSLLLSNIGAEFQQDGMYKEALDYFCKYLQEDPSGTNAPYAKSQAKILQKQLGRKKVNDRDVCAPLPSKDDDTDAAARPDTGRNDIGRTDPRGDTPRGDTPRGDVVRGDAGRGDTGRDNVRDPGRADTGRSDAGKGPTRSKTGLDLDQPAPPPRERDAAVDGNPTLMYTGLAVAGAGVLSAVYGAYNGYQAKKISDEISSHDPTMMWDSTIRDQEARGQSFENLQVAFLIVGGVAITTGVVLYVMGRPDGHERARVTVKVAPTGNGFAVLGKF